MGKIIKKSLPDSSRNNRTAYLQRDNESDLGSRHAFMLKKPTLLSFPEAFKGFSDLPLKWSTKSGFSTFCFY